LASGSDTIHDALLTIPVTFTVGETVEGLRIEHADARPRREGYYDEDDALGELVALTAQVPGLEALVDNHSMPAFPAGDQWEAEVNGKHVIVTLQWSSGKDHDWVWSLEVDVSGETAAVYCYVDDAWVAGSDGSEYSWPVGLVSDDKPAEFSLARFALGAIYGTRDDAHDQRPNAHD
jgi:hypothetical protein